LEARQRIRLIRLMEKFEGNEDFLRKISVSAQVIIRKQRTTAPDGGKNEQID